MTGTIKMFCIRMNILFHRNNIELFLPCNMAAMQNLYIGPFRSVLLLIVNLFYFDYFLLNITFINGKKREESSR